MRNSENGWSIEEAGMAQLDDIVGSVMKYLKDNNLDDNTIVVFTTDNGTENFTWPDGGKHHLPPEKERHWKVVSVRPALLRWPGHVPAGKVENGFSQDWTGSQLFWRLQVIRISHELLKGKTIEGTTYKVHLDGYDQTRLITGKGPSNRHEIFYFTESTLAAVRIDDYKYRFIDQPGGWIGSTVKPDMPTPGKPSSGSSGTHHVA